MQERFFFGKDTWSSCLLIFSNTFLHMLECKPPLKVLKTNLTISKKICNALRTCLVFCCKKLVTAYPLQSSNYQFKFLQLPQRLNG